MKQICTHIATAALTMALIPASAICANRVWNGGQNTDWSTALCNWGTGLLGCLIAPPAAGDNVTFNNTAGQSCALTQNTATIANLTFSSTFPHQFSFSEYTIYSTGNVDMSSGADINAGTGKLEFTGGVGVTQTFLPLAGDTMPEIVHSGAGTLRLTGALVCKGFTQTSGRLDLNGYNITVTDGGNFSITKNAAYVAVSGLNGRTITVSGSASFNGSGAGDSIDLNVASWTIAVSGSLIASYALIGNSNAGGGSTGMPISCRSIGTNTNWAFGTPGKRTWSASGFNGNSWGTAANWSGATLPASTDTVVFSATSTVNCDLNGAKTVKALYFAPGYTGTFNFGSDTLTVLAGPASFLSGQIASSTGALKLSSGLTQILTPRVSDTLPVVIHSGNGLLQLSTNPLVARGLVQSAGTVDFNACNVTITNGGSFNVISGSSSTFTGLSGRVITVSGNASLTGQSSSYLNLNTTPGTWIINCSGALVAQNATLQNSQSTGSVGAGISCTNTSGNNGWVFGTTLWEGGNWASPNNWATNANWSSGAAPNGTDVAIFSSAASANCNLGGASVVSSIVFTSGCNIAFDFNGQSLTVNGSVASFSSGGAINSTGGGSVIFAGAAAQSFTPKTAATFPAVSHTGAGTVTVTDALNSGAFTQSSGGGTWDWGDLGKSHTVASLAATNGSMDFGTSTVKTAGSVSFAGISAITTTVSCILEFTAASATQTITPASALTAPCITHTGAGTLKLVARDLSCRSFAQSAGVLDFAGFNISTTAGGFSIINGRSTSIAGAPSSLGGRAITVVGGNACFDGTTADSLNLDPLTGWTVTVSVPYTISASLARVGRSTAVGAAGQPVNCRQNPTASCTNWSFGIAEVSPAWTAAQSTAITGGAGGDDGSFVTAGVSVKKLLHTNGSTVWTYTPGAGVLQRPVTFYRSSESRFRVYYASGNNIGSVADGGGASAAAVGPTNTGAAISIPVPDPDDSTFIVVTGNQIQRRRISDNSVKATGTLTSASTTTPVVVDAGVIYAANTSGRVFKFDYNLTAGASYNTGKVINMPMALDGTALYVSPLSYAGVWAINAITMGDKWTAQNPFPLLAASTGEMFPGIGSVYLSAGNYVYKITDNGTSGGNAWAPYNAGATVNSGPLPYNGKIYFGRSSGRYYALTDATGALVSTWPHTSVTGDANASPWIDWTNSRVLFSSSSGTNGDFDAFSAP